MKTFLPVEHFFLFSKDTEIEYNWKNPDYNLPHYTKLPKITPYTKIP